MPEHTRHIISGHSSIFLARLREPQVMGVIWRGAFSVPATEFIAAVAQQPKYNIPGRRRVPLLAALEQQPASPGLDAFIADMTLAVRLFQTLSKSLLKKTRTRDLSRIEPAQGDSLTQSAGNWHVDADCALAGLAVLAGPTSEYIPQVISGRYGEACRFDPDNPAEADALAEPLGQRDFMVFKSGLYPYPAGSAARGLVHRRPNARLNCARPIVHLRLHPDPDF